MSVLRVVALVGGAIVPGLLAAQSAYEQREEWWVLNDGGCSLYVAELGAGTPLVVVHGGWGAEHQYLVPALDWLATRFRLVFYDQRGSLRSAFDVYRRGGSRPCPDSLLAVDRHVADLERLREELREERLDLVAHSMGTFLALSYLERHPDRVGRLVLIGPGNLLASPRNAADSALAAAQRRAADSLFLRPVLEAEKRRWGVDGDAATLSDRDRIREWRIRFAAGNLFHVDRWRSLRGGMAFYNGAAGTATARTMPPAWNFVPAIEGHRCRVTVIAGDHDFGDIGARILRTTLDGRRNVRLVVLARAGHAVWLDQPERFRAAVESALEDCQSSERRHDGPRIDLDYRSTKR